MALAQIYSAVTGHVITAARWNNEFGNIYGNGTDLCFPATKAVSFAGYTVTMDAAGVSTITSPSNSGFLFTIGAKSGTPGTNGQLATITASTFTDTNTAAAGTAAMYNGISIRQPTLAAANAGVITTKASTVYIENAPAAGSNETLTNAYALYVDAGKAQFDGDVQVEGTALFNGKTVAPTTDPYLLANLNLSVVMSANAITIALKTDAGTDPSTSDPVYVRFRSATLATSGTTKVGITSALSLTVSSGSTLGTVSAQAHRLYVGLLNNAGTAELFVYNPLSGSNLKGLVESQRISTTSEGGAGAADSAQVAYSTTARTNVAFRIIGFFEATEATAGTWATAASTVQELQPWMPRTGQVVGSAIATAGTCSGNKTATIPLDDTVPQVGEGVQLVSVSYTPANACNLIDIDAQGSGLVTVPDAGNTLILISALFTDVSANAIATDIPLRGSDTAPSRGVTRLKYRGAGLGAMTSASLRMGSNTIAGGDVWLYNGSGAATDLSAGINTHILVTEIMV